MKNLINRALVAKKKLFIILAAVCMAVSGMAQNYPTKFLGIPIDGTKADMIRKIQAKGFEYNKEFNSLSGEFNGMDVNIYISTTNNKVDRIMVAERTTWSESQIRIRYNNLMQQFKDNSKYVSGDISQDFIPADEDISYEMSVNNKDYTAQFLQITHPLDTSLVAQDALEVADEFAQNFSKEDLEKNSETLSNLALLLAIQKQYLNNPVWFTISEYNGKYYLLIYYDNLYNKADGEDL